MFIAFAIMTVVAAAPNPARPCSYHRGTLVTMSVDTFDQSDRGWRVIGEKRGCERAAAEIIRDYLSFHPTVSAAHRAQLLWHEAQLLALVGDTHASLAVFRSIRQSDESQRLYRQATIAFLSGNKPALLKDRAQLASLPKPADFDATAKLFHENTGQTLSWPFNLDVVDSLVRCFGHSYRVAYSDSCAR